MSSQPPVRAIQDEIALNMQGSVEQRPATEIERVVEGAHVVYRKRWRPAALPNWNYWPQRENRILMRLLSHSPRHVVQVVRLDLQQHEITTEHAGATVFALVQGCRVWRQDASASSPFNAEDSPFSEPLEYLRLLRGVLVALQEIHALGFVHGDVKADNLCVPLLRDEQQRLIIDYGGLKLIDFAFALHRDIPLEQALPQDAEHIALNYLPRYYRKAITSDQRRSPGKPSATSSVASAWVDLHSVGAMAHDLNHAFGVRSTPQVNTHLQGLLEQFEGYARRPPPWRKPANGARDLIGRIDEILEPLTADHTRSRPFTIARLSAATGSKATPVTPLAMGHRSAATPVTALVTPSVPAPAASAPAAALPHAPAAAAPVSAAPAPAAPIPPAPIPTAATTERPRRRHWKEWAFAAIVIAALGYGGFMELREDSSAEEPTPSPAEPARPDREATARAAREREREREATAAARERERAAQEAEASGERDERFDRETREALGIHPLSNGWLRVGLSRSVTFDHGTVRVTERHRDTLQEIATALRSQDDVIVHVVGHASADEEETDGLFEMAELLASERAGAVARALQEFGIPEGRIQTWGRGSREPVVRDLFFNRYLNRTVDVVIAPIARGRRGQREAREPPPFEG